MGKFYLRSVIVGKAADFRYFSCTIIGLRSKHNFIESTRS